MDVHIFPLLRDEWTRRYGIFDMPFRHSAFA